MIDAAIVAHPALEAVLGQAIEERSALTDDFARLAAAIDATEAEAARAQQLARLIAGRLELKRLEVLQARLDRRRRAEALRRERKSLDELVRLPRGAGR